MLFNTIKNEGEYWLVDQVKKEGVSSESYQQAFENLLAEWKKERTGYLSLLMDEVYEQWLLSQGFEKISSIVEYTRKLVDLAETEPSVTAEALSDQEMSDEAFAELYDRCRSGSANKNNSFTIKQIMASLEGELGRGWRTHCFVFWKDDKPVGISIPHIEQGTKDEGRLFYFGVVPEQRGKGLGAVLHRLSLQLMKPLGASVYVGSTDEGNASMIRIFEKNGCHLRDKKGIYRITY